MSASKLIHGVAHKSNKDRLYVAIYAADNDIEDAYFYQWGFLIGPKDESRQVPGASYRIRETLDRWVHTEEVVPDVRTAPSLLARFVIAKVTDRPNLVNIFRDVSIIPIGDPAFDSRIWVREVINRIKSNDTAVGTSNLDWAFISPMARGYITEQLGKGRYHEGQEDTDPRPTYDMIAFVEVVR